MSFLVEAVHDGVQVLDRRQTKVKHVRGLWLLKYYQAVASLVQRTSNLLVQDHLRQLHQHLVHRQVNLTGHVVNLHLIIRQYDLFQIVFQQRVIQYVEVPPDHLVIKELPFVGRSALLELVKTLLLVGNSDLLHGLKLL